MVRVDHDQVVLNCGDVSNTYQPVSLTRHHLGTSAPYQRHQVCLLNAWHSMLSEV